MVKGVTFAIYQLAVVGEIGSESHVTLNVVGAVYADKSMSIKTKFTSVAQKYFNSMVVREDFQNNTSVAIGNINSWVAIVTENTITELVGPDSVTPSTKLLLVNAIYFKGSWAAPFNKFQTEPSSFYIDSNNSITVSMMHKKGKFLYYDNQQLNSQILAMDYQGKTTRLLIILPKEIDGLASLEKSFSCLNDLHLDRLNNTYVNASIPKFEISYSKDFSSTLQKLGMLAAFTPGADFSHISNYSDIFISSVLQKAYLKVDEAGTEAAAVSAVMMLRSSLNLTPDKMVQFNMDHPFLFLLQHISTKTIIFHGRVIRPSLA
uniref:(California timema) hypothetical protein n=1 Tax=Timema californicum TaxID=61474 RepID=A0A7R9J7N5_TIMCA|nr:unnamed protein product [Timema californicum]